MALHAVDLAIVVAYLAGMVLVGYLVAGRIRRFADFFVAGRALTTPILICTLVAFLRDLARTAPSGPRPDGVDPDHNIFPETTP